MSRPALRLPRPTVADRGVVTMVALLCTLIVVGAAGAGAWLRVTADDLAAQVFHGAQYPARQLQVFYASVQNKLIPSDADREVAAALPASLDTLLEPPRHAVTMVEAVPRRLPSERADIPAFLSVVGFPNARDLVDVVDGRFPRSGQRKMPLPPAAAAQYDGPEHPPVIEVALLRETAEKLQLPVGSFVRLIGSSYRPVEGAVPPVVKVVGLYEPAGAYPTALDDVDNTRRPAISTLPEFTMVRGAALAADDRTVLNTPWGSSPDVRWTFDADGVPTAAEAAAIVPDARKLAVQAWPPVVESNASSAGTGVGDLAQSFVAEREASNSMAALVLAALAAAAFALLLAAATVLEARRREVSGVLRARGAPTRHLLGVRGGEALLITLPGLVLAGALAWFTPIGLRDLGLAALAAAACVALLALAQVLPSGQLSERVRLAIRDALQIVVVALALGISGLMLWRGEWDAGDPLLLALPAVLGVAATVVALRLVRGLTAVGRRTFARGPRFAPLVGASQADTTAQHVTVPVLGVVLAGCCALLAVSVGDTVDRGADAAAWEAVGADVRVSNGNFDQAVAAQVGDLDGVEAVAAVHTANGILDTRVGQRRVSVVAVDTDAFAAVTRGLPGRVRLPEPAPQAEGTLRVLASADLDLAHPDTTLDYAQGSVPVQVVGRTDPVPGLTSASPFVIVDDEAFLSAFSREASSYDGLMIAGTPDLGALRGVVEKTAPLAKIRTREGVAAQTLEGAAVTRTLLVARAAAWGSVLLALFAAGLAVATGRPLRRRTLVILHALGTDRRQARWVNAWDLVPAMAGAAVAACGCLLLLGAVAGRGIDLGVLTGATDDPRFGLAAGSWLVAVAALAALVLAVAAASARQGGAHDELIPDEETR